MKQFLSDLSPRPLSQSEFGGIKPVNLYLGNGSNALEVAFYQSLVKPNTSSISRIWTDRKAGRSSPILTVIAYPDGVALCGPSGDQPPIFHINDLDELRIKFMDFFVDKNILNYIDPPLPKLAAMEEDKSSRFNIP